MRYGIVQHGRDYDGLVSEMFSGFTRIVGNDNVTFIDSNASMDISNIDFFFIWNKLIDPNENDMSQKIIKKMKNPYSFFNDGNFRKECRHNGCSHKFESKQEIVDYHLKNIPCPKCKNTTDISNNILFIFHGHGPMTVANELFNGTLMNRIWASTDADWRLFRCFSQAISFIPHTMLSRIPKKIDNRNKEKLAVFCSTEDEPNSGETESIHKQYAKICLQRGYKISDCPGDIENATVYIDRMEVGTPSIFAIRAMACGIPVVGNISNFYRSHYSYPNLPIIRISSFKELDASLWAIEEFRNQYFDFAQRSAASIVERFSYKRVVKQWSNLAEYILDPVHLIDHFDGNHNISKYWGFQGGYRFELK